MSDRRTRSHAAAGLPAPVADPVAVADQRFRRLRGPGYRQADPAPFRAALTAALDEGRALAVIVHDSAFCEGTEIAPLFAGSPLTAAPGIGFRQPYIGLIRADGRVLEFTGATGARLRETLTVETAP